MTTEAEAGGTRPQVQGCLGPSEAGRGRKNPPLEPWEGAWPCQDLGFGLWPLDLGIIFGRCKPPACGHSSGQPQDTCNLQQPACLTVSRVAGDPALSLGEASRGSLANAGKHTRSPSGCRP